MLMKASQRLETILGRNLQWNTARILFLLKKKSRRQKREYFCQTHIRIKKNACIKYMTL